MAENNHNFEPKEFQEKVIHIARVARVVKGGRRFRFRALVAVGNGKGKIGVGISKGADVQTSITKAVDVAKKNVVEIPIDNYSIPHESKTKFSGSIVLLKPASKGTGIIAGGTVRSVIELSGIQNILSKTYGSTNKVNVAYATIEALKQLVPKDQWINNSSKSVKKAPPKTNEKEKPSAEKKKAVVKKTVKASTKKKAPKE